MKRCEGKINYDVLTQRYLFKYKDDKEESLSSGNKVSIEIDGEKIDGRIEHALLFDEIENLRKGKGYYFWSKDWKIFLSDLENKKYKIYRILEEDD